jgi:hypothetical protein
MDFEIVGTIRDEETFASGAGIRERSRLQKTYGKGRWRKRKGITEAKFHDGSTGLVELHWYEASGIGRKEYKIKRVLAYL